MNATQASPIDRLSSLATQRTARTDRLHEATCALLSKLEKAAWERGASVTVDGYVLTCAQVRSNVGTVDVWALESVDDGCTSLEAEVDSERYLHGDFHA